MTIYWDHTGLVLRGWEITEPEILAEFQGGRRLALLESEEDADGELCILRPVPDPGWTMPLDDADGSSRLWTSRDFHLPFQLDP